MKNILAFLSLALFIAPSISFSQWQNLNSPHFSELAVTGNNIFGVEENTGVHVSTNDGISWTQTSLNVSGLAKIAADGNTIFAGTGNIPNNRGIYRSTNNGLNWTYVLPITEFFPVTAIAISGNQIFAATGRTIYRSTNNGTNWIQTPVSFYVYSAIIYGVHIYAGAESVGVYISTNSGENWSQTSFNNRDVLSVKTEGTSIYIGSETGVHYSSDGGATWIPKGLDIRYIASLILSSGKDFAGTDQGVYYSSNDGATWIQKNQGLSGDILDRPSLAESKNYIFASNGNSSTYRRSITEIINVTQVNQIIPNEYQLMQNYPNPFNPATKINFSLPYQSHVILKVFDLTGKEISMLVNEKLNSGTYEYFFNAASFSSGIYFYSLNAGNFSETKRMMLIK